MLRREREVLTLGTAIVNLLSPTKSQLYTISLSSCKFGLLDHLRDLQLPHFSLLNQCATQDIETACAKCRYSSAEGCVVTKDEQRRCAFSLVELMVAVGIIAVLVSLGLPRYQAFIARGRMAEAKVNLGHIASLQGIYRAEWNAYANLAGVGYVGATQKCDDSAFANSLGFAPDGCTDLRYGYTSTGGDNFNASAEASTNVEIYPGCNNSHRDKWSVSNSELKVKQDLNIVKYCE